MVSGLMFYGTITKVSRALFSLSVGIAIDDIYESVLYLLTIDKVCSSETQGENFRFPDVDIVIQSI